jgi:hypothetical protein
MSKLSHSSDEATMHKIERDARAREGAESAAMAEAELRAAYDRFCADLKRNLPPIEAEFNGVPSFEEWMEASCHE